MRSYVVKYTDKSGEKIEWTTKNEDAIGNRLLTVEGVSELTIEIKEAV